MHFAVAGKSSYEDERRSLCHHHMMISDAEGLNHPTVEAADVSKIANGSVDIVHLL